MIYKELKKLKSLKNINFLNKEILSINDGKFFKEITFKDLIKKNYNLIIFASANNLSLLSKFKLRKVVDKSYNEDAYVFNLLHEKISNNSARQFFLKDGPLAFLPVSSAETSVIWSIDAWEEIKRAFTRSNGFAKPDFLGQVPGVKFLMSQLSRKWTIKNYLKNYLKK